MLKPLKNKLIYVTLAALSLFVFGITLGVGAHAAFAQENIDISTEIHKKIDVGESESSSTPVELHEVSSHSIKIKQVLKEKNEENATTSSSTEKENGNDSHADSYKVNFMTLLNTDRLNAIAELKKKNLNFETRMKVWHSKIASTSLETKIKLSEESKTHVSSNLNVILARFKNADNQMQNVSNRLANYISVTQTESNLKMDSNRKLLALADAKLGLAKDDVSKAEAEINARLLTTTSKEELKAAIETAKDSLKDAYRAYKDVILSLRFETHSTATTTSNL